MENYQIITDEQLLKDFIQFLPELWEGEKYYCCLFARSKYCKEIKHISSDKIQMKRFVSNKERLLNKIKQLECPIGSYTNKHGEIPQEALALYITINPRNMVKATVNTMVKLAHTIRDKNVSMNPHQEAMSEIQKAKSRTCYVDFDFDVPDAHSQAHIVMQIGEYVNRDAVAFLQTRGGIHCLVDPNMVAEQFKKTFYNNIKSIPGIDQCGDLMIPVPGTYQGGHTPYLF